MDRKLFIKAIKNLRDHCGDGVMENLKRSPGRKPRQKDVELSEFFNSLNEEQKKKIKSIVLESVDMSLFMFFCILDHVQFLEDDDKSQFELYAIKGEKRIQLNNPEEESLHDMFNEQVL